MAATGDYIVSIPDSTRTYRFPKSMSHEEIRASLVTTGNTVVSGASINVDGDNLTFQRPTGGRKGN